MDKTRCTKNISGILFLYDQPAVPGWYRVWKQLLKDGYISSIKEAHKVLHADSVCMHQHDGITTVSC